MKKINTEHLPPTSIVIITLNEEKRLPRLLNELTEQTYQNFQLIVSDSNSTDKTQEVVEQYTTVWRELLFHQCWVTNGPARWRNRGAEQAKNEIIFFFDADTQLWNNAFLENALSHFLNKEFDVASTYIKPNTANISHHIWTTISNIIYSIFQYTSLPLAVWWCMMSKKSVHQHINWFDENITLGEDSAYAQTAKKQWYTFWILPQRFIFDMRRIENHWARKTSYTYLKTLFHLMRWWDFPHKTDTKQVDYTFDQRTN